MIILSIKKAMTNNVNIGLSMLFFLVPATIMANWHTADLNPQLYYTLALTHSLSINCLPYFLFGLLSFAFFHTEKGKRIALPANLAGLALVALWVESFFYYNGNAGFTIESLTNLIDTVFYLSFFIGSLPFIYFYFSTRGSKHSPHNKRQTADISFPHRTIRKQR